MERREVRVPWEWITLSLALVVSLAWGFNQLSSRRQVEAILSARYQQAFFDALGHIENVEVLLSKALVSGSPRENIRYLSELWQQAFSAQANLNELPLRQGTLMRTSQFLTQLGDYSFSVSQQVASGGSLSEAEWTVLQQLHREVSTLGSELAEVARASASGQMPWEELQRRTNLNLNPFSKRLDSPDQPSGFIRIEQQMQEFPTLVYDGPFSDHVSTRKPMGLTGDEVTATEARDIARQFVGSVEGVDADAVTAELVAETGEEAPIAAWRIEVTTPDRQGGTYVLDVSKQGGHVLWMLHTGAARTQDVGRGLDEAVEIARAFLEQRGFTGFEVTYPVIENGRAIVPFVWLDGETLIYPDQLKVTVALDTGEVAGFDAMQYYTFHHDRSMSKPAMTRDEAQARVRKELEVEEVRLALIPRPDLREVLTYEVRGRMNGMLYHVYVNAQSGDEEQIFRIIESEAEGRMAI